MAGAQRELARGAWLRGDSMGLPLRGRRGR
jgi:hypothetical protein